MAMITDRYLACHTSKWFSKEHQEPSFHSSHGVDIVEEQMMKTIILFEVFLSHEITANTLQEGYGFKYMAPTAIKENFLKKREIQVQEHCIFLSANMWTKENSI